MKRLLSSLLVLILIATGVSITCVSSAAETGNDTINRYNVVFVTDASGSMISTDPNEYRFDAIDLFVGLLANGGNRVGSVVFNTNVISNQNMIEVTGKSDKSAITNDIRSQPAKGWTDIGGALLTSVNMLKNSGDKNLPSIIVFLTDGNTELSTKDATDASIQNKETALEEARGYGYKIYTICLNADNSANTSELKQIASATGGEFHEVTKASDLQDVFNLYYQLIYSTQSTKLVDEGIPNSGVLTRDFNVADLGVEEVNIIIFGNISKCSLTPPNGNTYSDSDINNISYSGKTFTLLKVVKPDAGKWNLQVYGNPGTTIKVFKIYNSNFQAKAFIKSQKNSYKIGTPIDFIGQIYEGNSQVTDISKYNGYKATLQVKDYAGNILKTVESSQATADGFSLEYTPTTYGTFYATVSIENDEQHTAASTFALNVGNTPPVAKIAVLNKHIIRWPFLIKTDSTINLSGAAKDNEDATLKYKVVSSTWLSKDYTLDGSKLTINRFSVSKGSFTIQAYDSQGAYCTFKVKVTSTDIGVLAMIFLLIGAALILAIMLILLKISLGKAFMGTVTAENIDTGQVGTPVKNRGRLKLSAFQIGQTGLRVESYFQATGKNYIYFISKKPFLSDSVVGKTKKLKIESGSDVKIFSDEDRSKGIYVRFESMLNNGDMF